MVLAAGLGTRMRPLTNATPKPLIPVNGKALIDFTLDRFARAGVLRAIVNVHYRADQVEDHLRGRKSPEIILSDERALLLETGGGLKKARAQLGEAPFYCANTDAIFVDEGAEACATLARAFDDRRMDALLLLVPRARASGYDGKGDFDIEDGRPVWRTGATAAHIFTGLQILRASLLDGAPEGPFSTRILWEKAMREDRIRAIAYDGAWLHVGDPEGLALAERFFDKMSNVEKQKAGIDI